MKCDSCGQEYAEADRWVVARPRPSDPQSWCSVLWLCPACGAEYGGWPEARAAQEVEARGGDYEG